MRADAQFCLLYSTASESLSFKRSQDNEAMHSVGDCSIKLEMLGVQSRMSDKFSLKILALKLTWNPFSMTKTYTRNSLFGTHCICPKLSLLVAIETND